MFETLFFIKLPSSSVTNRCHLTGWAMRHHGKQDTGCKCLQQDEILKVWYFCSLNWKTVDHSDRKQFCCLPNEPNFIDFAVLVFMTPISLCFDLSCLLLHSLGIFGECKMNAVIREIREHLKPFLLRLQHSVNYNFLLTLKVKPNALFFITAHNQLDS